MESDKFLRFMVLEQEIEANVKKVKAIMEMNPPWSFNEVQKLVDRIAALNMFVSRSTD